MPSATDLLRLLEPTVRPAGLPTGGAVAPTAPSASGRFEAMLAERVASPPPADPSESPVAAGTSLAMNSFDETDTPVDTAASPLTHLSGIDRIENPALRNLLGQRAA